MEKAKIGTERKHFIVPEREPFVCEHCGGKVMGGGYVDHCPFCLWSKHVDEKIPGDRASSCGRLMQPIGVSQRHGTWRIHYECTGCGIRRVVDAAQDDDFKKIIELSKRPLIISRGRKRSR